MNPFQISSATFEFGPVVRYNFTMANIVVVATTTTNSTATTITTAVVVGAIIISFGLLYFLANYCQTSHFPFDFLISSPNSASYWKTALQFNHLWHYCCCLRTYRS